jgi:hypothetical protein
MAGWKLLITWLRCEMLGLPPGPACELVELRSEATVLWLGCEGGGRDHRIVAWAPGGDGLVVNRRALKSGTAIEATT